MDKLWCARRNIIGNETGKVGKSWMMKASIRNFDCILSMLESHEEFRKINNKIRYDGDFKFSFGSCVGERVEVMR